MRTVCHAASCAQHNVGGTRGACSDVILHANLCDSAVQRRLSMLQQEALVPADFHGKDPRRGGPEIVTVDRHFHERRRQHFHRARGGGCKHLDALAIAVVNV